MHRREFLHPKHLAHAAVQVWDVARQLRALEQDPVADAVLLRFSRQAMATNFEIVLPFGTPAAQAIAVTALDEIDRLEGQLTVYRDDSEVSRLNHQAARTPVVIEEQLFQLLARAQRLHEATAGAFDVAIGSLTKAWGFYRRQGGVPTAADLAAALECSGLRFVELDPERRSAFYTKPGVEINLGSIGKGYALDQVVRLVCRRHGFKSMFVHGGHSSVFALGHQPGSRNGWPIGLLDPGRPARRLGVVNLHNRGLAISAATYQHFVHEGRQLGHILDPRTGWPAEGIRFAAVTAPTAAEADALATAFYILGVDFARTYCAEHPQIGAILAVQTPSDSPPLFLGRASAERSDADVERPSPRGAMNSGT